MSLFGIFPDGSDGTGLSRRSVLRNAAAVSALGAGAAGRTSAAEHDDFVETEWGYKHRDLEFDTSREWPVIMEKAGYGNVSWDGGPNMYLEMPDGVLIAMRVDYGHGPDGNYAEVVANIRGTGCSGGNFDLYDRRHAWDGHEIIEWIADQEWSNGKVGLYGCSFMGQTPYWIASTQPPSLEALFIGGLHADIYRDLVYPGGVQNTVFPVVWYYEGPNRVPHSALQEGDFPQDEICTQNQATRYSDEALPDDTEYMTNFLGDRTYGDWWAAHAAWNYADDINVPYYQHNNWHDEQTGPRGAVLFKAIDPPERNVPGVGKVVPKKLVTSSGDHCHGGYYARDLYDWMDIWLRGKPDHRGMLEDRVENYFETTDISQGKEGYSTVKTGDDWPFPGTEWRDLHLQPGGGLAEDVPDAEAAESRYLSGVPRENWFYYAPQATEPTRSIRGLPDSLAFETEPLEEDLAIAGPILFDMYASLLGTNTEFFVSINDVLPDGRLAYVQRGLQRASFRAVNEDKSFYTDDGRMYQPWRPYTNPQRVVPGDVERYRIEVFPVGHVFREGHRIRIQIHTPPVADALSGYTPEREPAVVSVQHDQAHPSLLRLPVVEPDEEIREPPQECGVPNGFPCSDPITDEQAHQQAVDHASQLDIEEELDDEVFESVSDDRLAELGLLDSGTTGLAGD